MTTPSASTRSALELCELADQLRTADTEEELLTELVHVLSRHTTADWLATYLVDPAQKSIWLTPRHVWLRSGMVRGALPNQRLQERDVSWKSGVVGRVARNKTAEVLNDEALDLAAKDLFHEFGTSQSAMILPIVGNQNTAAVLTAGRHRQLLTDDDERVLLMMASAASAHWSRITAARASGVTNKSVQRLIHGLSSAAGQLRQFRRTYGMDRFLPILVQVALSLIRAQGCLLITPEPLTSGLYAEGCHFQNDGRVAPIDPNDNLFVEVARHLRTTDRPYTVPDLTGAFGGPLSRFAQEFRFLSCLVTPVSLFTGLESFLLLFSWSRDAFGKIELAAAGLVGEMLDVLAVAHETAQTISYIQRTAVLAQQIAGTTHELRNFATNVGASLYWIQQDLEPLATSPGASAQLTKLFDEIKDVRDEVDRLQHRVEILRSFRRKGEIRPSLLAFDLNELIRDVCRSVRELADAKDISIITVLDKQQPLANVVSDPELIRECVSNLLWNAIYFTPEKGRIEVGTSFAFDVPNPVRIWVKDEGKGIHKSEFHKIFEPFYSTKSDPQQQDSSGTGLGLFLTKNNVTLLGGDVDVDSSIQKWAKFTIHLPLRPQGGSRHGK